MRRHSRDVDDEELDGATETKNSLSELEMTLVINSGRGGQEGGVISGGDGGGPVYKMGVVIESASRSFATLSRSVSDAQG